MLTEVEFCPTKEVIYYTSEGKHPTEVERKLSEEGFCFTTVDSEKKMQYFVYFRKTIIQNAQRVFIYSFGFRQIKPSNK